MKCSMGLFSVPTAVLVSAFLVSGDRLARGDQGSVVCHSGILDDVAEDNLLLQAFLPRSDLSKTSEGYSYGCRSDLRSLLTDEEEEFIKTDPINRHRLLESDSELDALTSSSFSIPDVSSYSKSERMQDGKPVVGVENYMNDDATLVVRASPPSSPRSPSPPPIAKRKRPSESPPPVGTSTARSQQQSSPRHEQAVSNQPDNARASSSPTLSRPGPSVGGYRHQLQQINRPNIDEMAVAHLMQRLGVPPNGVGSQVRQTLTRAMENRRLRPASPRPNSHGGQQAAATSSPSSGTTTSSNQRRSILVSDNGYDLSLQSAGSNNEFLKLSAQSEDHSLLYSTSLQMYKTLSDDFMDPDLGLHKRSILSPRTPTLSGQGSSSPLSSMAENESRQHSGQRSSMGSISAPASRVGSPDRLRLAIQPQSLQQQPIPESPRLDRIQSLPSNANPLYNMQPPAVYQRTNTLQFLVDVARSNRAARGSPQPSRPQFRPHLPAPFQAPRPALPSSAIPPSPLLTNEHNPFAQFLQHQPPRAHSTNLPHNHNQAAQAPPPNRNQNTASGAGSNLPRRIADAASARIVQSRMASTQLGSDGGNGSRQGSRLSLRVNHPYGRDVAAGNQQRQQRQQRSGPPTTPPAVTPRRQRSPSPGPDRSKIGKRSVVV